jgi:hypothetical protein
VKHYVQREVPAKVESVLDHTSCDLCGVNVCETGDEVNEVFVYSRQGFSCPDGSWGTETTFDVCGKCFTSTLVPFMDSKGAKPTVVEWDF